jgi:hypothetical protein
MWPNSSAPNFSSPWDLATRLPALRGSVLFLTAILAVLTVLMALLESDPTERLLALLWTSVTLGGSAVLVVWLAWRPVDAWQRIRGGLPAGVEVVRVELRVLNWDVFKQRGWQRFVDSPWNGPYNEAALLVLPDRLVMMGIKGVPFPTSRHGLPVHPVELLPDGETPPQLTAIPAVRVLPVWSRDGSNTTIPDRYRVIDPAHEGELTLVIKSGAHLFHDRFGRAGTQKAD